MNYSEIPTAVYVAAIVVLYKLFEWLSNELVRTFKTSSDKENKFQNSAINEVKIQYQDIKETLSVINRQLTENQKDYEHISKQVWRNEDKLGNVSNDIQFLKTGFEVMKNKVRDLENKSR